MDCTCRRGPWIIWIFRMVGQNMPFYCYYYYYYYYYYMYSYYYYMYYYYLYSLIELVRS